MKFSRLIGTVWLLCAFPAWADTNLFDNGGWTVEGATDPDPAAQPINVTLDKQPAGVFSEIKIYNSVPDAGGLVQIFSITGRGAIQPILAPPSVPGGVISLTQYWDCNTGLSAPLAITDLDFKTHSGAKKLSVRGKISNGDSLEATDLKIKFNPGDTNLVTADVRYKLVALRDLCVDRDGHHPEQAEFQLIHLAANFISVESNQNNRVRFTKLDDKTCNPYTGCDYKRATFCADLEHADGGYLYGDPRKMAKGPLLLLHTNSVPLNTPTLGVDFRSPGRSNIKPQAFVETTEDPTALNASVWGNWVDSKKRYRTGRKVCAVHCTIGVRDPSDPDCDTVQKPPAP